MFNRRTFISSSAVAAGAVALSSKIQAAETRANTKAGDVILMHSWGYHTLAVMPEIIARLKAKGLQCVTVSQLLAAGSKTPKK